MRIAQRLRPYLSLSVFFLTLGFTYAEYSGRWLPVGLYIVGFMDFWVLTMFTRFLKQGSYWRASNMGGVSNVVTLTVGMFASEVAIKNPDGVIYVLAHLAVAYVGGLLGTRVATMIFPEPPQKG